MQTSVHPAVLDVAGPMTFPFAEPPAAGHVCEVAPGVYWLRMPLPFALNHINLWLLRDGKPQTLALRVGLSDGNLTELIEGDLHEGDALIVDAAASDGQPAAAAPAGPGGMRRLF